MLGNSCMRCGVEKARATIASPLEFRALAPSTGYYFESDPVVLCARCTDPLYNMSAKERLFARELCWDVNASELDRAITEIAGSYPSSLRPWLVQRMRRAWEDMRQRQQP